MKTRTEVSQVTKNEIIKMSVFYNSTKPMFEKNVWLCPIPGADPDTCPTLPLITGKARNHIYSWE